MFTKSWRDDPIFIGINRLVAKGLVIDNNNTPPEYPCSVANRFECPYENGKSSNAKFDVDDLYDLASMAFAVEIALAVARKDTSAIQIKNKQDLYRVVTNREMFNMVLEQGHEYILSDKETFNDPSRFNQLQKDDLTIGLNHGKKNRQKNGLPYYCK